VPLEEGNQMKQLSKLSVTLTPVVLKEHNYKDIEETEKNSIQRQPMKHRSDTQCTDISTLSLSHPLLPGHYKVYQKTKVK
jgi:hypothetical protein